MRIKILGAERLLSLILVISSLGMAMLYGEDIPFDLETPIMEEGPPKPGKRVKVVVPEYEGTEVYHTLYLPKDWLPNRTYPVIVEYTGNKFAASGSSGEVKDANLGYGISGGEAYIWVTMPYVEKGLKKNALNWWGNHQATVDYCKRNLPKICEQYGGDLNNVLVCGFSRGSIATSYIGLADDEIASLWKGILTHDHFDGEKKWGYENSDRDSAMKRLKRLKGRPVLVSSQQSRIRDDYLSEYFELADFTFVVVPTKDLFSIPEGKVVHSHTDLWMHKPSKYRAYVREWVASLLEKGH